MNKTDKLICCVFLKIRKWKDLIRKKNQALEAVRTQTERTLGYLGII